MHGGKGNGSFSSFSSGPHPLTIPPQCLTPASTPAPSHSPRRFTDARPQVRDRSSSDAGAGVLPAAPSVREFKAGVVCERSAMSLALQERGTARNSILFGAAATARRAMSPSMTTMSMLRVLAL
jgi:hypothetical protein